VSERLGDRHFKGAHACLEAQEALIHGLEPPIYGLEPLMDFRPKALKLLVHQEHALAHQLDPGFKVLGNDVEVAAGLRMARPHLCPQLLEAPIHLDKAAVHRFEAAVHRLEAPVHRFEAPFQIGDKLRVHAGTLPPRRGGVKCLLDETRSRLRRPAVQMMWRRWARLLMAALLFTAAPAAAQTITWQMANEYPATSIHGEGDQFFAKELLDRSGGRIVITHSFDAALGYRSRDLLEAVARGTVPVADMYIGALGDVHPIFLLPSLPFLAVTPEQARLLNEVARPDYERVLARHNQKLLYPSPWPPAGLWAKRPIAGIEALRGLRVRTPDANATATLRAAGALPSQLSLADALPKIKSGAIEAVLSSGDGGAGQRLWEHLRYFTAINYSMTMSMVTMNLDVWNELDTDLRLAVQGAARATSERQWKEIQTRIAFNYERMRANNVGIITEVTPGFIKALREAGQIAVDDWLLRAGPRGQEILETHRKQVGAR
jgi:TRAP-type transport system periplasmic protein